MPASPETNTTATIGWSGPVSIVHGEQDFLVPVAAARAHAAALPQAELEIFDPGSHFLIWTRPESVASSLAGFVARAAGFRATDFRAAGFLATGFPAAGFRAASVRAAGFRLAARSALLENPQDDHTRNVFDPEIRGRSDRFLLRFEKPAAID